MPIGVLCWVGGKVKDTLAEEDCSIVTDTRVVATKGSLGTKLSRDILTFVSRDQPDSRRIASISPR